MRPDLDSEAARRLNAAQVWGDEPEVVRFLSAVATVAGRVETVIELGAYRMHCHDPTPTWPDASWIGVDWRAGPGVTHVGIVHEIGPTLPQVDVVLSLSALEHDPHWSETLAAAVALAKVGGLVAMSCAGRGFPAHEEDCAPGGPYYRNVTGEEAAEVVSLAAERLGLRAEITIWEERRTVGTVDEHRTCLIARLRDREPATELVSA